MVEYNIIPSQNECSNAPNNKFSKKKYTIIATKSSAIKGLKAVSMPSQRKLGRGTYASTVNTMIATKTRNSMIRY